MTTTLPHHKAAVIFAIAAFTFLQLPKAHAQFPGKTNFLQDERNISITDVSYMQIAAFLADTSRSADDLRDYKIHKPPLPPLESATEHEAEPPYATLFKGTRISPDDLSKTLIGKRASFYIKGHHRRLEDIRLMPAMRSMVLGGYEKPSEGVVFYDKDTLVLNGVFDGFRPSNKEARILMIKFLDDRHVSHGVLIIEAKAVDYIIIENE